jgi:hypothetical protein
VIRIPLAPPSEMLSSADSPNPRCLASARSSRATAKSKISCTAQARPASTSVHTDSVCYVVDTKQTMTIREHPVAAELARRGWAPALTRDGLDRTDILAVMTEGGN